ncbi:MAG: hypothetical protein LIO94_02850, partial [Clostridiales bacterium]|nr:hypothetical protein [Clostridiales bacterium]
NYTCPLKKTGECDNPAVNDVVVVEFTINYILNMLNAKKNFSKIATPADLQKLLFLRLIKRINQGIGIADDL